MSNSAICPIYWTLSGATTPCQRAKMDLGAVAMKEYSAFPKLQHYWNPTNRLFTVITRIPVWLSYISAEMQSLYSKDPIV